MIANFVWDIFESLVVDMLKLYKMQKKLILLKKLRNTVAAHHCLTKNEPLNANKTINTLLKFLYSNAFNIKSIGLGFDIIAT